MKRNRLYLLVAVGLCFLFSMTVVLESQHAVASNSKLDLIDRYYVAAGSEWLDVDDWDEANGAWTETGADPWLDVQDEPTNYISARSDALSEGWFSFPNTAGSGTFTVNISIYAKNDDGAGNDHIEVWVDFLLQGLE